MNALPVAGAQLATRLQALLWASIKG